MIEKLELTPEEFYKRFINFISNEKPENLETETVLDDILKNGIPKDKIMMFVGTSCLGIQYDRFVEYLKKSDEEINKDSIIRKWEESGLLNGLTGMNEDNLMLKFFKKSMNHDLTISLTDMDEELYGVCPKCGNDENFHFNYDYSKKDLPVIDILCNECGELFEIENNNNKIIN